MAQGWRDGLAQWLRALTAHPEDLSLISEPISEVKYKSIFFFKKCLGAMNTLFNPANLNYVIVFGIQEVLVNICKMTVCDFNPCTRNTDAGRSL